MKTLLVVVLLVVAALVAYNFATTGEVRVLPQSLSAEERAVKDLERQLGAAKRQFEAAARGAGLTGVDFSAEAEAAKRQLDQIESKLKATLERLQDRADTISRRARDRAQALKRAVEAFRRELE